MFAIPGQGVQIISPQTELPAITTAVELIDGFSQPDYGATPLIELSGSQLGTGDALVITASNVTIRGLDINDFYRRCWHPHHGGRCYRGLIYKLASSEPIRRARKPNPTAMGSRSTDKCVGEHNRRLGHGRRERDLRKQPEWSIHHRPGTSQNVVSGNLIGTDALRDRSWLGNADAGVYIDAGSSNNTIGGTSPAARNIIAANGANNYSGVNIYGSSGNLVEGNYVGTYVSGPLALGNRDDGVSIFGSSTSEHNRRYARRCRQRDLRERRRWCCHLRYWHQPERHRRQSRRHRSFRDDGRWKRCSRNRRRFAGHGQHDRRAVAVAGNVVAGNDACGLFIVGSGTSGNVIQGNLCRRRHHRLRASRQCISGAFTFNQGRSTTR